MAASGASTRGPFLSSLMSGERDGSPSTTAVKRRGVTKVFISLNSSPASPSALPSSRARSSRARACMRAGISSENNSSRSSAMRGAAGLGLEARSAARLGELAHARNISLPLGDRDHAASVEQIEDVGGLDRLVVGGQHHQVAIAALALGEQRLALGFGVAEVAE